jgi:uncharacterized protein YodC (DUF2158 family)
MPKFKVGETCRLNSGSPLMTVASLATDLDDKPIVNTTWFEGNKEYNGQYREDMLTADDGTL